MYPRALVVAVILVASAAAHADTAPWTAQVATLLERRARAVTSADIEAFAATMSSAPAEFIARQRRWFDRVQDLPLASYKLEIRVDPYEDLAGGLARAPRADEVRVVEVTERLALRNYDPVPTADDLYLTVTRTGTRWSIVADDDLDDLGLLSARTLWDFGNVGALERDGVLILHHGDARAATVLREIRAGIVRVKRQWPFPWDGRVVVMIPKTSAELGRILQATVDLGPFVAFTASSVERLASGFVVSGHRVYVQPDTYFDNGSGFRSDVLGHELLHHASRAQTGLFVPAWLDEGIAQVYGERARSSPRDLRRSVRAGSFTGLPEDWIFVAGTNPEIKSAYESSASFVGYLKARFGSGPVTRFYREAGSESPVSFGTARYHLDRAARAAFGSSLNSIERAWVLKVRKELG